MVADHPLYGSEFSLRGHGALRILPHTHWNEFSLALILITKNELKTLPLGLAGFYGQFSTDWGPVGASLVIASFPVIILYIFFSNKVSDAMAYSGMKN